MLYIFQILLAIHHPPGHTDSITYYSKLYELVIAEYHDVIALHLAGHTHNDEFSVVGIVIILQRGGIFITINNNNKPRRVFPDSKVHGANMGPIWGRQDPGGPHGGPMSLAIWVVITLNRGGYCYNITVWGYFYDITVWQRLFSDAMNINLSHFIGMQSKALDYERRRWQYVLRPISLALSLDHSKKKKNGLLLAIYSVRLIIWRHDTETFSELPALFETNPPVADGLPPQRASNVELWRVISC